MSTTRGPYRLEAFEGDRVTVYGDVALPSGVTLTGGTLQFRGYDPSNALKWDSAAGLGDCSAAAEDADSYTAEVYTSGFAAGFYPWEVRRTDAGAEAVLVYGTLQVYGHPRR